MKSNVIDMHAHIWDTRNESDERKLLEAAERYGIDRIFVSALAGWYPDAETVERLNQKTERFAKAHSDCISGYVYVSPELPNAVDVLRRGIEDQGMIGVKFWVSALCDDPIVNPVVERLIEYGVPLLIHAFKKVVQPIPTESLAHHVANLARRYPECKIIMAHMGGNCYHGIPIVRDCPNIWVDHSGTVFRADELRYTVEQLGAERVLFGTDMPGPFVSRYGQLMEAPFTDAEKRMIGRENTLKLFDTRFRLNAKGEPV